MVADKAGFRSGRWKPSPGGLEFADDYVTGFAQAATHCDALGHMWFDDQLWNGYPADSTNGGMTKASIEPIAARGITGRCVLLDVARHRGKTALERAETFDHQTLLDCAAAQGVDIQPRSILLVRTGWLTALTDGRQQVDSDYWEPGLTFSRELVEWFQERQIPCLVTDTLANESTYEPETGVMLPLHAALMRNLGVLFTEVAALDELAANCADDGQYEALYCASPLKITRGTGGSVNPVVVK
jgi:kynurenine formamidase